MMYFYQPEISTGNHTLEGEEMQHCVKVLRNKIGDQIGILDGKGGFYKTIITAISSKSLSFNVEEKLILEEKKFYHHLVISPTKNADRNEWLVEKACELGVDEISLIITKNSERTKINTERLIKKAVSALKQSKSGYITKINEAVKFSEFLKGTKDHAASKFLAYVSEGLPYFATLIPANQHIITMIGPEGDFSPQEVQETIKYGFEHISLGTNVLRTETAGIVACQFVNIVNHY
jgi:16S rRNA (uracil1498-N3)-methyltransferase